MADRAFVDTNVLVYAVDASDPAKRQRALEVLDPKGARDLVLSTQVLSEFYVVVTRKLNVDAAAAAAMVAGLARLPLVVIDGPMVLAAIEGSRAWNISYWDALVVRAAETAGCRRVLSEDLTGGSTYDSIVIENPFAPA